MSASPASPHPPLPGWSDRRAAQFAPWETQGLVPARVVRADRDRWLVLSPGDTDPRAAVLRGRLRHAALGPEALPAVGDWVALALAITGEGPAVVLNKADVADAEALPGLVAAVEAVAIGVPVVALSARAGDGLEATFADVEALAAGCRFGDCAHEAESGCAVRAALEDGTLDRARHASWVKLRRELRAFAIRHDARLASQERARWKSVTKTAKAHMKQKYGR